MRTDCVGDIHFVPLKVLVNNECPMHKFLSAAKQEDNALGSVRLSTSFCHNYTKKGNMLNLLGCKNKNKKKNKNETKNQSNIIRPPPVNGWSLISLAKVHIHA